jgi:hypothetical protein
VPEVGTISIQGEFRSGRLIEKNGGQGQDRTADTRIFSPAPSAESPVPSTLTRRNPHGYVAVAIGSPPMATGRTVWNGASMGQVACE